MFSLLCRLPGWYKNAAENKDFLYYKKVLIFLLTKFSTLLHGFYHSDRNVLFQGATNVPLVKAGQAPLSGHHKSRPHSFPKGGDAFSLFRAAFFCSSIMILDRDYRNPPHHRTLLPQTLSLGVWNRGFCPGKSNPAIAEITFCPIDIVLQYRKLTAYRLGALRHVASGFPVCHKCICHTNMKLSMCGWRNCSKKSPSLNVEKTRGWRVILKKFF